MGVYGSRLRNYEPKCDVLYDWPRDGASGSGVEPKINDLFLGMWFNFA